MVKPIAITVSDKTVGEKIDNFLQQFHFNDYLCEDDMIIDQSGDNNNNDQSTAIIRYDRDFLIQLRTNNDENYMKNLMKSSFIMDLLRSRLNLFRFHIQ